MVEACLRVQEEDFDTKMQMVAWQTALLMNSTGNYKKKIKPVDLYTPLEEKKEQEQKHEEKTKEELQQELLSAFAGSL